MPIATKKASEIFFWVAEKFDDEYAQVFLIQNF